MSEADNGANKFTDTPVQSLAKSEKDILFMFRSKTDKESRIYVVPKLEKRRRRGGLVVVKSHK